MKKTAYNELKMEVISFDCEDVITTSGVYPSFSPITYGTHQANADDEMNAF